MSLLRRSPALRRLPLTVFFGLSVVLAPSVGFAQLEDDPLVDEDDLPAPAAEAPEPAAQNGSRERILVIPYQPIFRSAEAAKAAQATDLVVKELGRNYDVVRGGVAKDGSKAPSAEKFEASLAEAREAEAKKDIDRAIELRQRALAEMEANAGAIPDAETFIRAHHELARAQMWAGRDEEAAKTQDAAARMAPGFDLPARDYSRFYRRRFEAAAKRAVADKPAELLVRSALPGAKVLIDGREAAIAPVRLEGALPGKHLLQAQLDGVPTAGQVVTLRPGKNPEVTISFGATWGGVAIGAVADAVAGNELGAPAVKKAVEAGQEAEASFVAIGGMAHDKVAGKFNVHSFVVNVKSGGVMKLEMANFDLDMLTAESDVIRVVRAIEQGVKNFGDAKQAIASIEGKVQRQDLVNAVDAKPDFSVRKAAPARGPERTPAVRRPIRVLKSTGTLRIKDEEE